MFIIIVEFRCLLVVYRSLLQVDDNILLLFVWFKIIFHIKFD